ncbi:hypothetical protein P835_00013 [Citrobacter portucalensis]|nr:hypothetical protein P835_00013 [Citrobacter portucalensis]
MCQEPTSGPIRPDNFSIDDKVLGRALSIGEKDGACHYLERYQQGKKSGLMCIANLRHGCQSAYVTWRVQGFSSKLYINYKNLIFRRKNKDYFNLTDNVSDLVFELPRQESSHT